MNIIDKNSLLNAAQKKLLQDCAQIPFSLGKFSSIDDILTQLGVNVHIKPDTNLTRPIPAELEEIRKHWENEVNRLKNDPSKNSDYYIAHEKLGTIRKNIEYWAQMPLRGLYVHHDKAVILYPNEMRRLHGDDCLDQLLVTTLVHEAMHAYFNRPGHDQFPYVIFVEEPLAEFGMLLYLHETGNNYFDWALEDVRSKKTCYSDGAYLMDKYLDPSGKDKTHIREYFEDYKINLNFYDIPNYYRKGGILGLPQSRGSVAMPKSSFISVNGYQFKPKWKRVLPKPPRYFYDSTKNILGLDGAWIEGPFFEEINGIYLFEILFETSYVYIKSFKNIYLGDNFSPHTNSSIINLLLSQHDVQVSRKNKLLKSIIIKFYSNKISIPVFINGNKPALRDLSNGHYGICRKGKWGVIDEQLNPIIDFKYDYIWSFDTNGLIKVQDGDLYRLVRNNLDDLGGLTYDKIPNSNPDGTYTVEQNGVKFKIDQYGNKVP